MGVALLGCAPGMPLAEAKLLTMDEVRSRGGLCRAVVVFLVAAGGV